MELFIIINTGLFVYTAVILLLRKPALKRDAVSRRLAAISNSDRSPLLFDEDLDKPISERLIRPLIKAFLSRLSRFAPQKSKTATRQNTKLKANLLKAGFGISPAEYSLYRGLFLAATTAAAVGVALLSGRGLQFLLLSVVAGVYIGFAVTRYHLTHAISKRKKAMDQQLPDVLDLLSVNVEAGLGFEQAVSQVIGHMKGPIIDELTVAYREMSLGRTRRDALIQLGARCDMEEMKSIVGALVQAGQMGISIKNVLRAQAAAMRQARRSKIEEKAMKISVKILIPMVMFIFPVIFIVLLGPAALNMLSVMG